MKRSNAKQLDIAEISKKFKMEVTKRLKEALPVQRVEAKWKAIEKIRREIGGEKLWTLKKEVVIFEDCDLVGDDQDLQEYLSYRYRLTLYRDYEELGTKQLIEIARPSWIQCGGWHLVHYSVACENYIVPHNKRGVLSICNNGKNVDNYTQFFVTLEPTAWMDYKYVAFGQLIHGDHVLYTIEHTPTRHEEPIKDITITKCGEYNLCQSFDKNYVKELNSFLEYKHEKTYLHHDIADLRDAPSILLRTKFMKNYYAEPTDKRSHIPIQQLPSRLTTELGDDQRKHYLPCMDHAIGERSTELLEESQIIDICSDFGEMKDDTSDEQSTQYMLTQSQMINVYSDFGESDT
ncbi:hypothetical protein FQA39_LY04091 [Lamprigera yunnana]|nr:hypothetical protein FQA39_LY04091 [Lamprigera yunnana]